MSRILSFTGTGKGKTTAALGMILRAVGHDMSVTLAQFFKNSPTGELEVLSKLPEVTIFRDGLGLVTGDKTLHKDACRRLWQKVLAHESETRSDMLVLDEIFGAIYIDAIDVNVVSELLQSRPDNSITVLTGRNAPDEIIAISDTVSDITCVKHAYQCGIKAEKGVEF